MRIGLNFSRQVKVKGVKFITTFEFLIIMSLLLLKSGDIELNPGPYSLESDTSSGSNNLDELVITNNFSIVHYNIQSLLNKVDLIGAELVNFDVICLTETWLDRRTADETLNLEGYKFYRRDRDGDCHGGVCVYVNSNVHSRRRTDLEQPDTECIWVEVTTNHRKFLLGTFYRPPNALAATYSLIEDSISLAFDTNIPDILITGDFNLDIQKDSSYRKVNDLCQQFSLQQLITDPTHYTETSSSIIDLIFTSNSNNILVSGIGEPFLEQNVRYHSPVYAVLKFHTKPTAVYQRHIWLYDRGDFDSMAREIQDSNWDEVKDDDVDIYAKKITDQISKLASKYIPNKIIKVRQSDPPWLTNNIKKMMRKRKRLYDKYKRSNNIVDFENFKQIRNRATNEIRKSKHKQTDNLAQKLTNNTSEPKDWWKTLKQFIKPDHCSSFPPLIKNEDIYSEDMDKANLLNQFFAEQTHLDETNSTLPPDIPLPPQSLDLISTTPQEVEIMLKTLKLGKAAGPDAINNRILKELSHPLSFPLCDLFNFSLLKGKVPAIWKEANVTPVFKKDDPSCVSSYRPISLLNTIGKVLEKVIHKHVFNFFRDHDILTPLQSGFVPQDSTANQLVDIYNTFCKALDEGKEVRAVFCDISKAFDRVWHRGLLYKLQAVGISGPLLQWFTDYLNNRKQRVVLPGVASNWLFLKAGVPQGSILGPLLFVLYINDIVDDIQSTIRLFADDTSLYVIVDDPPTAAGQLNSDLAKIHSWAKKWLVTFNPSKSESVVFSRKRNKPNHPPLSMNQELINEVTSHKHLGLIFSDDCSWHEHFDYIKSKACFRINVMRKLKFKLDRKSLQIIYSSFIRPLLEYADVVWDNCTQNEVNELEKIQNEAARIVTGSTKLVSIHSLLQETGWETLASRRKKHKLILFFKMQNGLSPYYLSSLLPPTVGSTTHYNLRNDSDLHTVYANTQQYYNSFLPSAIRGWNELSEETRNLPSVASFKRKLNSNIETPPLYYFSGKRKGQIYHSRLRTNCSSLSQHLYSKNLIASPFCDCGAIEDTRHFLLECIRFNDLRQDMTETISLLCNPTFNTLLYGNNELTNEENEWVFLAVQEFLIKSKRFEQGW